MNCFKDILSPKLENIHPGTQYRLDDLKNQGFFAAYHKVRKVSKSRTEDKSVNYNFQFDPKFISTILDTMSALIIVLDCSGRIKLFNKSCEKITGYSFDEVKEKFFWDIFLIEEEVKSVTEEFKKLQAGNFPMSYENYWRTRSGELCFISWNNNVLLTSDNANVEYVIGCGIDQTPRKRVQTILAQHQEQIIKSERLLKEISSSIPGVVFQSKLDKAGILSFNYISDGVEELMGLSASMVYQKKDKIFDNIPQEELQSFMDSILESARGLHPWSREYRFKNFKSSETGWLKGSSIPKIDENGEIIWNGTIIDISAEKAIEQKLQEQNEELLKINKELDRFVYSTSHDLRAPLTSVMGLLNLIREDNKEPEINQYLDLADKSIGKFDKIIRNILEYSRNNRTELELEEICFNEIIKDILEHNQFAKGVNNVKRIIEINQPYKLYTDRSRVRSILENLLINSLKYTAKERESWVHIHINAMDGHTEITIADNGIGIPSDQFSKIFEMFYRATEKSDGAGLGLYIVKETLRKLKGTIKVESELNIGTVFKLILPDLKGD